MQEKAVVHGKNSFPPCFPDFSMILKKCFGSRSRLLVARRLVSMEPEEDGRHRIRHEDESV